MTLCNLGDILLTTHTNFMKMKMGLSIRVRRWMLVSQQLVAVRLLYWLALGVWASANIFAPRCMHATVAQSAVLSWQEKIYCAGIGSTDIDTLGPAMISTCRHAAQIQLMDMVYRKALRLGSGEVAARGVGGVVNLQVKLSSSCQSRTKFLYESFVQTVSLHCFSINSIKNSTTRSTSRRRVL